MTATSKTSESIDYSTLFIGGRWQRPHGRDQIDVVSATTDLPIGRVPRALESDVDDAVSAARKAFDDGAGWSRWEPERRADVLRRLADELERRGDETARRVAMQNGMPISVALQFEGRFPARYLRYYADLITRLSNEELRAGAIGADSKIIHTPIGVVAAIVPWNVPQAITFLKIAPALAAGCAVVLKPAEETVLDAFLMAEAVEASGLPPGVLNIVSGGRDIGAYLVAHPDVDKVTFTGSTGAGRAIGAQCGTLIRPVTLELGGKSAAVILDDVDLDLRRDGIRAVTLLNNGQVCWLNTRVIAPRSRYDEVVAMMADLAETAVIGDPLDPATTVGPLVSRTQRSRVEEYIRIGQTEGARLVAGGRRPAGREAGNFLEPTIFADVDNHSRIAQEEIFGPVICVIPYDTVDEAIRIANDSPYGLGGTVWSEDRARAESVARRIETGTIGINGYAQDPAAPFGGVKGSGLGRERGPEGLRAFQVSKTLYL